MKRIFTIALAAFALLAVSCTTDNLNDEIEKVYTLELSAENYNDSSRVGFNMTYGNFYWHKGDAIAVGTTLSKFTTDCEDRASSATFTGYVEPQGYAIYPYEGTKSIVGNVVTFEYPTTYTYESVDNDFFTGSTSLASPMWLMIAYNYDYFYHLGGTIAIKLPGLKAGNNQTFTLTADKKITGEFSGEMVDMSSKFVTTATDVAAEKSVTINFSLERANDAVFYVPVPTGTYNFTITVTNGEESFSKEYQDLVVDRGDIRYTTIESHSLQEERLPPSTQIWYSGTAEWTSYSLKDPNYPPFDSGIRWIWNNWDSATGRGIAGFETAPTKILDRAFYGHSSVLTSLTLPDGITEIGKEAFYWNSALRSVRLPATLKKLGQRAFMTNTSLESITIPESVDTLEYGVFEGCSSLRSVTIPKTDKPISIGNAVFGGCTSLEKFIGGYASDDGRCLVIDGKLVHFAPAGITDYTTPAGITDIGVLAFYQNTKIQNITISEGVESIGNEAFKECTKLVTITLPETLKSIGNNAFYKCSFVTITLPETLQSIGHNAFILCSKLENLYCKATTPPTIGNDILLYANNANLKIYVPASDDDSIINAYKNDPSWSQYADKIVEYAF
ncbi:MAG: leucine-rich repeat domain-containing protein [Tidjanibacter sp.]|nr:leucine-rich repeat domain-containing protein [Tidjanibacter sp.]